MGGIPFAFCTLLGCFFLLLGIFVHKIGAVGNSIALIVLLQLLFVYCIYYFYLK